MHEFIRDRIEHALGDRSWAWLAREAEIPQSTLASQKSIPRFSVATLVAVAYALDKPVTFFLPPSYTVDPPDESAVTGEIEELIRRSRGTG